MQITDCWNKLEIQITNKKRGKSWNKIEIQITNNKQEENNK